MEKMVVGFVFNEEKTHVLLIKKNRPQWQAGKINGMGGHIEKGEGAFEAVSRECAEEFGLSIPCKNWKSVAVLRGKDFFVHFFAAEADVGRALQTTDEEPVLVALKDLSRCDSLIPNLHWLIPLSLENSIRPVEILEIYD